MLEAKEEQLRAMRLLLRGARATGTMTGGVFGTAPHAASRLPPPLRVHARACARNIDQAPRCLSMCMRDAFAGMDHADSTANTEV